MAAKKRKKRNRSRRIRPDQRSKKTRSNWRALWYKWEGVLVVVWVIFLYVCFLSVPSLVGRHYGHGWGIVAALAGVPTWATLGIRWSGFGGKLDLLLWYMGYWLIFLSTFGEIIKFILPYWR